MEAMAHVHKEEHDAVLPQPPPPFPSTVLGDLDNTGPGEVAEFAQIKGGYTEKVKQSEITLPRYFH